MYTYSLEKQKLSRFRKPYQPFFGAYSNFFFDIWELFFYFWGILNDFYAYPI